MYIKSTIERHLLDFVKLDDTWSNRVLLFQRTVDFLRLPFGSSTLLWIIFEAADISYKHEWKLPIFTHAFGVELVLSREREIERERWETEQRAYSATLSLSLSLSLPLSLSLSLRSLYDLISEPMMPQSGIAALRLHSTTSLSSLSKFDRSDLASGQHVWRAKIPATFNILHIPASTFPTLPTSTFMEFPVVETSITFPLHHSQHSRIKFPTPCIATMDAIPCSRQHYQTWARPPFSHAITTAIYNKFVSYTRHPLVPSDDGLQYISAPLCVSVATSHRNHVPRLAVGVFICISHQPLFGTTVGRVCTTFVPMPKSSRGLRSRGYQSDQPSCVCQYDLPHSV